MVFGFLAGAVMGGLAGLVVGILGFSRSGALAGAVAGWLANLIVSYFVIRHVLAKRFDGFELTVVRKPRTF